MRRAIFARMPERRRYAEEALALARECQRLRRETQLSILFAATQLWRARLSLQAARHMLGKGP